LFHFTKSFKMPKKRVLGEIHDNVARKKTVNNVGGNMAGTSKQLASPEEYAPRKAGKDVATQTKSMLKDAETQTAAGDKVTTTTPANKKGKDDKDSTKCVEECLPGERSSCAKRNGKQWGGQFQCTEVYEELERLGVTDFEGLSKCLLAGMLAGYVKVPAGGDLDTVLYELQGKEWECKHKYKITLRMLLYQDDHPDSCDGGSVSCQEFVDGETGCPSFGVFLTQICSGKPRLESWGKFHNHCTECPGFGRCLGDYRTQCRQDKKTGEHYENLYYSDEDEDNSDPDTDYDQEESDDESRDDESRLYF